MDGQNVTVYAGTYSNVPVYEIMVGENSVYRRRADDYINATHILKVADLDKPARTRVLEKEVQQGTHEKVQGGFGKYQGTWVPLSIGRTFAQKYNVYHLIAPLFEFVPGDVTPPPMPKRSNAGAPRPRANKATKRNHQAQPIDRLHQRQRESLIPDGYVSHDYPQTNGHTMGDDTPPTSSVIDESDLDPAFRSTPVSRKRKRETNTVQYTNDDAQRDLEHRLWADQLLDYFMVVDDEGYDDQRQPPLPPHDFDPNRPLDAEQHYALHWAAAMGSLDIARELLAAGARAENVNIRGQTALARAVDFSNCYDLGAWPKMIALLQDTITMIDINGCTVLHHAVAGATSVSKASRARYYVESLFHKLQEILTPEEVHQFANVQNNDGDTAFHIAARNSKRVSRPFQGQGCNSQIPNNLGETVDQYYEQRAKRRHLETTVVSSSPARGFGDETLSLGPDTSPFARMPFTANDVLPVKIRTDASRLFKRGLNHIVANQVNVFIQACEAEMEEKETALNDTELLLQRKTVELNDNREKISLLLDQSKEPFDVANISQENKALRHELESLIEQRQQKELQTLVDEQESRVTNHVAHDSDDFKERLALAKELQDCQSERAQIVSDVLHATSLAGMGSLGNKCKLLVHKILGIEPDDIQDVIDQVLDDMTASKQADIPAMNGTEILV